MNNPGVDRSGSGTPIDIEEGPDPTYAHYLTNPWQMDTDLQVGFWGSGAVGIVSGGWALGLGIGGATVTVGGTASALNSTIAGLATPGVTAGFVGVGATAGTANGLITTYIGSGGNAGVADYAMAGSFGTLTGGLNPFDGVASLVGGGIGWGLGIGSSNGGNGYLIGSSVGSIITPGWEDLARGASLWHAAGRSGIALAGWGGAVGGTLANGGSLDSALFYGNFGAMGAGTLSRILPCFPAGTPILTPDGSKLIEDLRAGDLVLSRDEHNVDGPVGPKVIEEIFVRQAAVIALSVGGQTIRTTREHPFFVQGQGWTAAEDLVIGDRLSTSDDRWLPLEYVLLTEEFVTVYNFRVADWHTYFVGTPH